ncbi:HET domain-containing protein [Microdochium nivale]|nr:HET domain-containing protein [Microdochium nivale]
MAAVQSSSDSSGHVRPYRITDRDRHGDQSTSSAPHTCAVCEPLMVLVGGNVMSEHTFAFSKVVDSKACKFMVWCLHMLDLHWGRPKSGESLVSRMLKLPGRFEAAKVVVQISATATLSEPRTANSSMDKVKVSLKLINAPEFARGVSRDFMVVAENSDVAAQYFSSRPVRPILQSLSGSMLDIVSARMPSYSKISSMSDPNKGLPSRLLDLGPNNEEISPRLIAVDPEWEGQYLCLSYCWGGDQPLKATTGNLAALSSPAGFAYQDLPKTPRDACLVTKLFGQRYIWIDALCIVQDDPADKAREIPKMRDIYRGALLTIVASRSSSAIEGFLHDRFATLVEDDYIFSLRFGVEEISTHAQKTWQGCSIYRSSSLDQTADAQEAAGAVRFEGTVVIFKSAFNLQAKPKIEPLQRRAWAFQERLLSSRVIDFSSFQTSLQDEITGRKCQADGGWVTNPATTESLTSIWDVIRQTSHAISGPTGTMPAPHLLEELYKSKTWAVVIREYTKLGLTVASDKLAAVEGLAEWFGLWLKASRQSRDRIGRVESASRGASSTVSQLDDEKAVSVGYEIRYLAGIWSHHLPVGLMWHVDAAAGAGAVSPPSAQPRDHSQQDGFGGLASAPTLQRRPQPWRAPSWAWSCVDSPVVIPNQLRPNPADDKWPVKAITAHVVSVEVTPATKGDVYGPVSGGGHLVLEAPMFPVTCRRDWTGTAGSISAAAGLGGASFGSVNFDACSIDDECRLLLRSSDDNDKPTANGQDSHPRFKAWCVQILLRPNFGIIMNNPDPRITEQLAGLVVLEVPPPGSSQGGGDQAAAAASAYTRIGVFESELRASGGPSFEAIEAWRAGFEVRRIKLI